MVGHQETKKFLCRHINRGFNFKWSAFKRAGTPHRASLERGKTNNKKKPLHLPSRFWESNAQLSNLRVFTVVNARGLIISSSKSLIARRLIVLYVLVIKNVPTKINMYFTVIKQELILYFFTSSHLVWHWMVMCTRERSIRFNPRKIRLEN